MNEETKTIGKVLRRYIKENHQVVRTPKNEKQSKTKMFTPKEQARAEEFSDLLDKFDEEEEAPQTPSE